MADDKSGFDLFDLCSVDTTNSTDDGCPTPSTTMSANMPKRGKGKANLGFFGSQYDRTKEATSSHDNYAHHIDHHPMPHEVGVLRTREMPHRILGLVYGQLRLLDNPDPTTSGILWHCTKTYNWYGFRNLASGTFLGHGKRGKISATNNCHGVEEYLVPIKQEGGGFILHTFHLNPTMLWQVAIVEGENGGSLIEKQEGGTAWDFVSAKHVCGSFILSCPGIEEECVLKPVHYVV